MSIVRHLSIDDYDKGYAELLGMEMQPYAFQDAYTRMMMETENFVVAVLEDTGKLVGTATLFIENKPRKDVLMKDRRLPIVVVVSVILKVTQ